MSPVTSATNFKIGDLVRTKDRSRFVLASSAGEYPYAIVASVSPFVLISEGQDMMWYVTIKPEFFTVCGSVSRRLRRAAIRRFWRGMPKHRPSIFSYKRWFY